MQLLLLTTFTNSLLQVVHTLRNVYSFSNSFEILVKNELRTNVINHNVIRFFLSFFFFLFFFKVINYKNPVRKSSVLLLQVVSLKVVRQLFTNLVT